MQEKSPHSAHNQEINLTKPTLDIRLYTNTYKREHLYAALCKRVNIHIR